jgi:hypothetical protein
MVVSQKKGNVRYSIDLDRKTIKRQDKFGVEVENITPMNFENVKRMLSNKMVENLAKIKQLESYGNRMINTQKNKLVSLKKQNKEIIRFMVSGKTYIKRNFAF